uniref:C2H2-type domain-containing protein n=1 Tax=Denticeps clupeoides TaxID=299321 RepID=A0AAY4ACX2_9TELE
PASNLQISSHQESKFADQRCKEETEEKLHQFNKYDNNIKQVKILETRQRNNETHYQCEECGKSFTRASNFKSHKRTHTGEKPYQCGQCGKSFSYVSLLKRHKRTHIANIYQCTLCSKCFRTLDQLNHHQHVHTEEKAVKCSEKKLKKSDIITPVNLVETLEVTVKNEKQDLDDVIHSGEYRKWVSFCKYLFLINKHNFL